MISHSEQTRSAISTATAKAERCWNVVHPLCTDVEAGFIDSKALEGAVPRELPSRLLPMQSRCSPNKDVRKTANVNKP
eukprot:4766013-Amphidinium_carterae.1